MNKYFNISESKFALGFLILSSVFTFSSCTPTNENLLEEPLLKVEENNLYHLTATQFKSSGMRLGKFEKNTFHKIVKSNGIFDVPPKNRATVSTYYGGTIKNIELLTGEKVKKGQVLFVLENPDYVQIQQDYLEAQGQLKFLKSDFDRQTNLVKDNVTSKKTFLKSESDYTVIKVKLESLGKKLTLMGINPLTLSTDKITTSITIYSPIDGYITEVNVARGAFLTPFQTAITIVDTDHLHLELNIFEKDLDDVQVGQTVIFKLQGSNIKKYKATVHLMNKTIDAENRTIGIHGHLDNELSDVNFSPGMYVEADILTTSESMLSLPIDAMVEIEGKYYVLVLKSSSKDGYSFEKKEVTVGKTNQEFMEIVNVEEFEENSEVLIKGAFNLITE